MAEIRRFGAIVIECSALTYATTPLALLPGEAALSRRQLQFKREGLFMDQTELGARLAGKRVLVVEDEPLLAFELVAELETAGALPVKSCPDIEHALQIIEGDEQFDAAILNVWLRRHLSFPVADALRQRGILSFS